MSAIFNTINANVIYAVGSTVNGVKNYLNDIPKDTPKNCTISFFTRFSATLLLTSSGLHTAVILGSLSAAATAIHALISPMFKRIFTPEMPSEFDFMRTISSLAIVTYFGSHYLHLEQLVSIDKDAYLYAKCIVNLALNLFKNFNEETSWDQGNPLVV